MSFEEKLLEALSRGWFFNKSVVGIKRVKTLLTQEIDEHTIDKRLRFLFSRKVRQVSIPSPSDFAINMGSMGWWTSDTLFRVSIKDYREKIEESRANFLANLADPYFLRRFREIANARGLNPEELLRSIKFSLPARKIQILEINESQKEEIINAYIRNINRRILKITRRIRILLTKGIQGRKQRLETLTKTFLELRTLNIAGYRSDLILELGKAFDSIRDLNRRGFPNDLDKYIMDKTLPEPIKTEILELMKAAQDRENWWIRK